MPELPRHSVSVTGVVFNECGQVLAIQRRDDGRWVPPGGVLELDEDPNAGVVREVWEETGVKVRPGKLVGIYKNMPLGVVSIAIRCTVEEGTPTASDEATQARWIDLDEARALMPQARLIRVLDSQRDDGPFIRSHDGTHLL
ncbi:NUDIX hydrolase [Actinorugispora endophytica]|uniref:ADP-ribose pyrophosphatase YjhB (NUDIX family) n=1 Tax=Actinorugispora endophytica TaxID=1605990 RepID=A0A4R6UIU2_9ACTN|nr:NUDIX domain-containing protein [Actinorugispora endophytica]TDQ46006.1 ADP-ribose pyrophosphatase YjhB (NUDIX family) [Actinorugispora endophytica]